MNIRKNNHPISMMAIWFAGPRILLLAFAMLCLASDLQASDPPHDSFNSIECVSCHTLHSAPGGTLTTVAGNSNLCQSCHVSGGSATNKAMDEADQAQPGLALPAGMSASGTSHRWDAGVTGRLNSITGNTSTGTIKSEGAYTGSNIQTYMITITRAGDVGVAEFEWNRVLKESGSGSPDGGAVAGGLVALGNGLELSFENGASSPSFNLGDGWNLFVTADVALPTNTELFKRLENGATRCSTCHDQHSQELTPFDPLAPAYAGTGTGDGRHFQRLDNDIDQMCSDCHAARHVSSALMGSHPVGVGIPSSGDFVNPSSLPLDASGNIACLTCHEVHYSGTANGLLLRINDYPTLCSECHVPAGAAASHFGASSALLWPGGQYGSSFPAITDTSQTGSCANCHYPHGWPDSVDPTVDNPSLANDFEEQQCLTCHDGSPANTDLLTEFQKASSHPLALGAALHDVVETGVVNSPGRHVECVDCHNPHEATTSTGAPGPSTSPRTADGPLAGVQGIDTSGATVAVAAYEYEVCYRCHADSSGKPAAKTSRQFPNTNVRTEFDGTAASYHPVTTAGKSSNVPSLINGWQTNSVMTCTSCHNNNSGPGTGGASPNGAHGSTWPSLLERRYETADETTYTEAKYALCFNCHNSSIIMGNDTFEFHKKHIEGADTPCNICHDPHASGYARLINFDTSVVTPDGDGRLEWQGGSNSGSCWLTCHEKEHSPKNY